MMLLPVNAVYVVLVITLLVLARKTLLQIPNLRLPGSARCAVKKAITEVPVGASQSTMEARGNDLCYITGFLFGFGLVIVSLVQLMLLL